MAFFNTKAAPIYNDAEQYVVHLARPVTHGVFKYLPRQKPTMSGKVLNRIVKEHGADAIARTERK